jgi:uncharacterized protein YqhQ
MILSNFIEGLKILQPYYNKDGYHIGAGHDIFYAYATYRPLTDEDVKKMHDLGWFQEGCGDGDEKRYEPQDGWRAFT